MTFSKGFDTDEKKRVLCDFCGDHRPRRLDDSVPCSDRTLANSRSDVAEG